MKSVINNIKVVTGIAYGRYYNCNYSQCCKTVLRPNVMPPEPSKVVTYVRILHTPASGLRPTHVDGFGGVAYGRKLSTGRVSIKNNFPVNQID